MSPPPSRVGQDAATNLLTQLVSFLESHDYAQGRLTPHIGGMAASVADLRTNDADDHVLITEIERWVRWHRLPGYWLAFLYQLATQQTKSANFVIGSRLFAEAQMAFNEDLALSSLENCFGAARQIRDLAPSPAMDNVVADVRARLWQLYSYYRKWYGATGYDTINPLTETPYFELTWSLLGQQFPTLAKPASQATIDELTRAVDAATAASDVYELVVARRFLGLRYEAEHAAPDAARQYQLALETAVPAGLDTEIGHLYRLLGWVRSQNGGAIDSIDALEKAVAHEAHPRCRFWRAISTRELGDAVMRGMGREIDPKAPPAELARARAAYAEGRADFDFFVPAGVIPVGRGIAQQMFRSYTDNAIQAAMLANPAETLAEIEAMGRRMATDAVAEARAASRDSPDAYAAYRAARDLYGKDLFLFNLTTTPEADFAVYLENIFSHRTERQAYLTTRNRLTDPIRAAQDSLAAARKLLALRIPNTVFLVFHVGQQQLFCVLVDAGSGQAATCLASLDAAEWRAKHDAYQAAILDARVPPGPPPDPAPAMIAALDKMLEYYKTTLGGIFEAMLPSLKGRNLVVIPGDRMNEVPMHALPVAGKALAEHCVVGYTPSIGTFLQLHAGAADAEGAPLVVHDVRRTPFYAGTTNMLTAADAPARVRVEKNASWQGFRAAVAESHPRDLIFACHGSYDTDDPRRAVLSFTAENRVLFATLFAELDLGGCRSVTMGACESGRGRTLLSAEYVGLPLAFLAAGARCVIGSLWQLNQIASAILLGHYLLRLQAPDATPAIALTEAQRLISRLSQDDVIAWFQAYLPDRAGVLTSFIRKMGENPFAHPYYWAGLMLTGDV